jgi:hypothetical protein
MVYTDDTGEFFLTMLIVSVIIGAAIGAAVAAIQGGGWQDILIGMGIGAAAGLLGGLGAGAAGALGAGAAVAGAVGGFLGGFTSGVLSGFQAAGWQASGWKQALTMGAIEGVIGAITGGVIGKLGSKVGGQITKWQAGKFAAGKVSGLGRIGAHSAKFARAGFVSRFTQHWSQIIEEGTAHFFDVMFAGATAHPMSLLNELVSF